MSKISITIECPHCARTSDHDFTDIESPSKIIEHALREDNSFLIHAVLTHIACCEDLLYQYSYGVNATFRFSSTRDYAVGRFISREHAQTLVPYPLP